MAKKTEWQLRLEKQLEEKVAKKAAQKAKITSSRKTPPKSTPKPKAPNMDPKVIRNIVKEVLSELSPSKDYLYILKLLTILLKSEYSKWKNGKGPSYMLHVEKVMEFFQIPEIFDIEYRDLDNLSTHQINKKLEKITSLDGKASLSSRMFSNV